MKFHHIGIAVKFLEESEKFYIDLLGFTKIKEYSKEGWIGRKIVILEKDGMQLELFGSENSVNYSDDFSNLEQIGIKHLGLLVDDVESEVKKLEEKGVDVGRVCKGTNCEQFCFIVDPNGIVIELLSAKKE